MLSIIIIFATPIILFLLFIILTSDSFKLYKLKKRIELEYETKVHFSYRTKSMGTYLYIFTNDTTSYTISEFGNIYGRRNRI